MAHLEKMGSKEKKEKPKAAATKPVAKAADKASRRSLWVRCSPQKISSLLSSGDLDQHNLFISACNRIYFAAEVSICGILLFERCFYGFHQYCLARS